MALDPDHLSTRPTISVVIPTYQRLSMLRQTLEALAGQTDLDAPPQVIVVSDGSTDGTIDYLTSTDVPLAVTAIDQANAGPAAARNRGIGAATGDLVVFVDDDVVPAPDLLAAHRARHGDLTEDLVVIGPMRTPDGGSSTPWVQWEQDMLHKQYDAMERGDFAATARQFYTANASMPRRLLVASGGFDTTFRRAEDVELAYRLHDAGARFAYAPEAVVVHHAERTFQSWLGVSEAYGHNDVIFARDRNQPWLLDSIATEFYDRHRYVRALTRACVGRPRLAKVAMAVLGTVARVAGRLRLRPVTKAALSALYNLSYYRGMAEELGGGDQLLERFDTTPAGPLRIGFVLEQTLGHITHTKNLQALIVADDTVDPAFAPVAFDVDGWRAKIPGFGNWTVRAGIRARRAIRALQRDGKLDALFVHTQVPAVLVPDRIRRIPSVVSLDATPIQYDELGAHYGHDTGSARVERLKWKANRACFRGAAAVVTWADWTKQGLIDRYDVPAEKIHVIPPGVDYERWAAVGDAASETSGDVDPAAPMRVLFVGGDFERKGGLDLLAAVTALRAEGGTVELDVVTRDDVPATDGVRVHHGLGPNSPDLIALYHRADVFCLPTLGDCLPMVLSEAGAVGLPLVSTDVGAIREIVHDGETGLLVPVSDPAALTTALRELAADPARRRAMGDAARQLVRAEFDAATNARRLVELLAAIARERSVSA